MSNVTGVILFMTNQAYIKKRHKQINESYFILVSRDHQNVIFDLIVLFGLFSLTNCNNQLDKVNTVSYLYVSLCLCLYNY